MIKDFDLAGKVALVTGAGRGIGRGIALALAEAGADIVVAARTQAQVEDTAAEAQKMGRRALATPADVCRREDVERMVEAALSHFGQIDILVNSAGTFLFRPLVPPPGPPSRLARIVPGWTSITSDQDWQELVDTNLTGLFLCLRAVGPHLIQRRRGKVINMSSMEATKGFKYHALYDATKAGVCMLTRSLALEWAQYDINVNAIAPGYIPTELVAFAHQDPQFREEMRTSVPLRRFGEPREIGLLAVYLASEASNYITGQTIYIDGGVTAT